MSVAEVEARENSAAAVQERRTVGGAAMESQIKMVGTQTVRADSGSEAVFARQLSARSGGQVVNIEIGQVDTVDHKHLGRPTDKQYEASKKMVMTRLELTGWATATVISCLPVLLSSDSVMEPLRKARVKPVADGQDFQTLVFVNPHLEPAQIGPDAPKACYDFQPIQLAKEFERVYQSHGGVFAFVGNPEDANNPNWPHKAEWEAKKMRAIEWMQEQHREADAFMAQKLPIGVRESHRACIRRLHHLGHLKELPEYVDKKSDIAVDYPICSKCQMRQESPYVIECVRCKWILDVRRAYEEHVIDENSPHLERLTRATINEMGLSDYVPETADEKPTRIKAGLPKPQSVVQMRQMEAQEEMDRMQREEDTERLGKAISRAGKKPKGDAREGEEEK